MGVKGISIIRAAVDRNRRHGPEPQGVFSWGKEIALELCYDGRTKPATHKKEPVMKS